MWHKNAENNLHIANCRKPLCTLQTAEYNFPIADCRIWARRIAAGALYLALAGSLVVYKYSGWRQYTSNKNYKNIHNYLSPHLPLAGLAGQQQDHL